MAFLGICDLGFTDGFAVLSDCAEFLYKTTDYWSTEHESGILWNDPELNIAWPIQEAPQLSPKDLHGTAFSGAEVF